MSRRVDKAAPDASTLWLAIGLGGFSVIASFFLAIYYSAGSVEDNAHPAEANSFEAAKETAD